MSEDHALGTDPDQLRPVLTGQQLFEAAPDWLLVTQRIFEKHAVAA